LSAKVDHGRGADIVATYTMKSQLMKRSYMYTMLERTSKAPYHAKITTPSYLVDDYQIMKTVPLFRSYICR